MTALTSSRMVLVLGMQLVRTGRRVWRRHFWAPESHTSLSLIFHWLQLSHRASSKCKIIENQGFWAAHAQIQLFRYRRGEWILWTTNTLPQSLSPGSQQCWGLCVWWVVDQDLDFSLCFVWRFASWLWLKHLTPCTSVSLAGRKNLGLMDSKVPSSAGKPCLTSYLQGSLSLLSISSLCISWQKTLAILLGAFISSHETMCFVREQVYLSVPIALCRYQKIKKYFWVGWLVGW